MTQIVHELVTVHRPPLPAALQKILDAELKPNERVVWSTQPVPDAFARQGRSSFMFAIPWTTFSVFWLALTTVGVSKAEAPGLFSLFPLFGLPFVAIGIWMLLAPRRARTAAFKTAYVVTSERAIVLRSDGRNTINVRSFYPAELRGMNRTQDAQGQGDVILATDVSVDSDGDRRSTQVGFIAVPDAKAAEDVIRALIARHAKD